MMHKWHNDVSTPNELLLLNHKFQKSIMNHNEVVQDSNDVPTILASVSLFWAWEGLYCLRNMSSAAHSFMCLSSPNIYSG